MGSIPAGGVRGYIMNIIVMDLEWNQNSLGKKERDSDKPIFEIIEIGAVKLNEEYEIIDEFSQLINPQIYQTMHRITADLIHLQMNELRKGKEFSTVIKEFLDWCGEDYIFATWGPLDLLELQRNMKYYKLESLSNGPIKFYDVQKLFSLGTMKDKIRKTLEFAIDYFEIEKDIPFHRAYSDAYYTAKVFKQIVNPDILKLFSYDTFNIPKNKKEEIKVLFPDYYKYISRGFENKSDVMQDREVSSTKCYLCHKNLKKKIRWYSLNSKNYYSVSCCDVHGYIKYKVRVKKAENDKYYVIKTSKFITEEKYKKIQEECNKDKENKRKKKKLLPNQ